MSCPGLSPSPGTPAENVRDGVVSQFDLIVNDADFHAILSLAEPLYRHSCHVLSFLPAVDAVQQPQARQEAFLDLLPLHFTRPEALQAGGRYGIPQNTIDSLLKRMTEKRQLAKNGRGEYEFVARIRTKKAGS